MSEKPVNENTSGANLDAAKKSRPMANIDTATLTDGAKKTGRYIWGGLVVLATLGGVLGLFQFVKGFNTVQSAELSISPHSQQQLLQMVQNGKLSVTDAKELARALAGDALSLRVETDTSERTGSTLSLSQITELATSDDPDKRRALVLMTDRKTYGEGLDILEASAKTSEDWEQLGSYSSSSDPERALKAARTAISLDPNNLFAMSLLSLMQLELGDFSGAERTAQAYLTLSREKNDKIFALSTLMRIYSSAANKPQTEATFQTLKKELDNWTVPNSVSSDFSEQNIDKSPLWAAMHGYHMVGWQYYMDKEGETALEYINAAINHLEVLIKALPDNYKLLRRKVNLIETRIGIEGRLLKDETAEIKSSKEIYALRRKIFELGAPFSGTKLVSGYNSLISAYMKEGNLDAARASQKKQMDLVMRIRRKDSDSLAVWREWMTAKWGHAQFEKMHGDPLVAVSIADEMLEEIAGFVRLAPEDEDRAGLFLTSLRVAENYSHDVNPETSLQTYLDKALTLFNELEADKGNDVEFAKSRISFTNWAGMTAIHREQKEDGKAYHLTALNIGLESRKLFPKDQEIELLVASTYALLGYMKDEHQGDYNEKALDIFQPYVDRGELKTEFQQLYSMALGQAD